MVMYSVLRLKVRAIQRPASIMIECTRRVDRCGEMYIFWCMLSMMYVVWSRPLLCCLFCCGLDGVVGGSCVVSMSICIFWSKVWIPAGLYVYATLKIAMRMVGGIGCVVE